MEGHARPVLKPSKMPERKGTVRCTVEEDEEERLPKIWHSGGGRGESEATAKRSTNERTNERTNKGPFRIAQKSGWQPSSIGCMRAVNKQNQIKTPAAHSQHERKPISRPWHYTSSKALAPMHSGAQRLRA